MKEVRCKHCNKLLYKIETDADIVHGSVIIEIMCHGKKLNKKEVT